MNEKTGKNELKAEINHGNFLRAVLLAESLKLPEKEIYDLRLKALWQMSALYRNALGTKKLALEYGFSKNKLRKFLEGYAQEMRNKGDDKPLKACYEYSAGNYLSFEEWVDYFFKNWEKLPD